MKMYLHAFVLMCGIYLSSAANYIPTMSSGNKTSLKETQMPCSVSQSLPMNTRRICTDKFCTVTCLDGYKFPDGSTVAEMRCVAGSWGAPISRCLPECNLPCYNDGFCGAPNTCFCAKGFKGIQCQYSKCDQECQNFGTCVGTNLCNCAENFYGKYCEKKNECLTRPKLPKNSQRICSTLSCTVKCINGYKFPDGSIKAEVSCVEGKWQPSSVPDCM